MKISRIFFLLLVVSVLSAGNLLAQDGMVYFDPDTTYVTVNDSTEIDIAVDNHLTGIHCFIVSIGFDTNLVELVDVTEGALLPDVGQTFFFWTETVQGYDIGSCILGYGLYANGPGVLATMKFRARANAGASSLHFTSQEFVDTSSNLIYVIPLYGAIVVEDSTTGVGDSDPASAIPQRFVLYQNHPNPFNSQTIIEYGLREPAYVSLEVFDVLGRLQEILISGEKPAGYHAVTWDAGGSSSGIYYIRLNSGDYSETRKMLLIK